ncbi:hypothetical protein quinque_001016 [Culex quinquefasciatus]
MLSETSVTKVIVHLLVLLGVVDHFKRKLLGCWRAKSVLDVSDSFAVPSDEDDKDKSVWFLDHDYLENSYGIFKKLPVNHQIVYQLQDILNLLPDLAQEDFTDAHRLGIVGALRLACGLVTVVVVARNISGSFVSVFCFREIPRRQLSY